MVIVKMAFVKRECVFATQDGGVAYASFVDLGKFWRKINIRNAFWGLDNVAVYLDMLG